MRRAPTGWSRGGGGGGGAFVSVPQTDVTDEYRTGDQQQRQWTPRDFRSQIQQVLRQSATQQEGHDQSSVHSSPAFSDTTLVGGDCLDVPIRHYDEVDIGDYVEYHAGYYGPEAVSVPSAPSLKASFGLEVHSKPVASDLSPKRQFVGDPWSNISYHGSGGVIEEEIPGEPRNYKPAVLRWKFLVALFLTLVILITLAELAIQLLPQSSGATIPSQLSKNTNEIHPRSVSINSTVRLFDLNLWWFSDVRTTLVLTVQH